MSGRIRYLAAAALLLLNFGAAALIVGTRSDYRVNFDSVLSIWADFVRDADQVGLSITGMSDADEIEIGDRMLAQYYGPSIVPAGATADYVSTVGEHVAAFARRRDILFKFHILQSDDVNAYAVPGGHVFITTGMLAQLTSEAELAIVLGHEIAHVDLRHTVERLQYEVKLRKLFGDLAGIVGLAHDLVDVVYSSQQEVDADRTGLLMAAEAGYSPTRAIALYAGMLKKAGTTAPRIVRVETASAEVLSGLGKLLQDYFKTHPTWTDRATQIDQLIRDNEARWSSGTLCVGVSNYRDRSPCFEAQRSAERETISTDNADYQVDLGVLYLAGGQPAQATAHFASALRAQPGLADQQTTAASQSAIVGDDLGALARYGIALNLDLARLGDVSLRQMGVADDDVRRALRFVYVEHAALVTKLGRNDYAQISAESLGYLQFSQPQICRLALDRSGHNWNTAPELSDALSEIRRRGYQVSDCRLWREEP